MALLVKFSLLALFRYFSNNVLLTCAFVCNTVAVISCNNFSLGVCSKIFATSSQSVLAVPPFTASCSFFAPASIMPPCTSSSVFGFISIISFAAKICGIRKRNIRLLLSIQVLPPAQPATLGG